jgi:hypothetical protein
MNIYIRLTGQIYVRVLATEHTYAFDIPMYTTRVGDLRKVIDDSRWTSDIGTWYNLVKPANEIYNHFSENISLWQANVRNCDTLHLINID